MHFALSDEQTLLQESVRGTLTRDAPHARVRAWAEAQDLSEFDDLTRRQEWSGIGVPEERGGQGGGLVELAVVFEELGRAGAPSGRMLARSGGASGYAQLLGVSGADLERAIVTDEGVTLGHTANRPPDAPVGLNIDGGLLTGVVELVLDAPGARSFLLPVPVTTGQVELWLVDRQTAGVRLHPRRLLDRTRAFADLELAGASGERVGTVDDANLVAARAAVLIAAESLGLARTMLTMTTEYVNERVQFGVPVGSFQAVQHAAAQAVVDIEAAHSGVYYAAWAMDAGDADALMSAWIAKAYACEMAARVADTALMLHGAIGYTWEHDLQLLFKRAKLNCALYGSPGTYWSRVAAGLRLTDAVDDASHTPALTHTHSR